ncbi:MAG: replicative DNA helicase [Ignavibacteria bacterium]|nr:replicative DNA helicase [Ignavibacteria bacterium]
MGKRVKTSKNGDNVDLTPILGNFVPPHSVESEMAVLGAMLLDNSAITKTLEMLTKDSFYLERHKIIFETIVQMFEKGVQVDALTLAEELKKRNKFDIVGGGDYIANLMTNVPSAENVDDYCRIILERSFNRELLKVCGEIIFESTKGDVDSLELIDKAERKIFQIAEKRFSKNYVGIKKILHNIIDHLSQLVEGGTKGITGVPSGFIDLDRYLGGFQKSDLIIIAARPSVGKTAFALSIARNVAVDYNIPVGFFSLEMSSQQLTLRLISSQTGIDNHKIRTGNINRNDLKNIINKINKLSQAPLFIDDSPKINLVELRAKARRLKAEHNVGLIIIDYLQLIDPPKAESREREISIISRTLKQIAKELDIPIIALSQLNRVVETRKDRRPQLSDLRESGSIEQDADVVLFIYRPEIYGISLWPDSKDSTEGTAEIIIGKQRNGPTGSFRVVYLKDTLRFDNGDFRYVDEEIMATAPSVEEDYFENLESDIDDIDIDEPDDSF